MITKRKTNMELTKDELKMCGELPGVFLALADYHDLQESVSESMGCKEYAKFHCERRKELTVEANRITMEWESA